MGSLQDSFKRQASIAAWWDSQYFQSMGKMFRLFKQSYHTLSHHCSNCKKCFIHSLLLLSYCLPNFTLKQCFVMLVLHHILHCCLSLPVKRNQLPSLEKDKHQKLQCNTSAVPMFNVPSIAL